MERGLEVDAIDRHKHVTSGRFIYQHSRDFTGAEWLVLHGDGGVQLAFQQVTELRNSSWPSDAVPQQLHLDTVVSSAAELEEVRGRALELGARELLDRTDDPDEPLYVYADPAGHPFCIFVGD